MQYALMICAEPGYEETLSDAERDAMYAEFFALTEDHRFVGGTALQPVETATSVRVEGGRTLVTDGPFADTKEVLGGLAVIEAVNLDEVVEFAARIPGRAARWRGGGQAGDAALTVLEEVFHPRRHVFLPDRLHADRLGVLGVQDRPGLPAADGDGPGEFGRGRPARLADQRPTAIAGRCSHRRRRPVLVVPARRAGQLCRRRARPGGGHRRRSGPAVRTAHAGLHVQGKGPGVRGRGQSPQHRTTGWRLDRARRARHRRVDRCANSVRDQTAQAAAAAHAGQPARPSQATITAIYDHALATSRSRAFEVAAGGMLLALIIAITAIRVRRADLDEARI